LDVATDPGFYGRLRRAAVLLFATSGITGCATAPIRVSPSEIPTLEARLGADPADAEARIRYAAALFAAGDCDRARSNAATALRAQPRSEVGALIVGECLEREGRIDQALTTYRSFRESYPDAPGVDAVAAREELAARAQARILARSALAREQELGAVAQGDALGVLPFAVSGDEDLEPLSLGLATFIVTDLASIGRFPIVERVRLAAILDELKLARSGLVDPATAARIGRLVRAARLVQGSLVEGEGGSVELSAAVAVEGGEIVEPARRSGALERLLDLEKELVLDIAGRLGYTLTAAERQRVLENGTQSLLAFLAFSGGLEAEERGDYLEAARLYGEALDADPGFVEARERRRTVIAMRAVSGSSPEDILSIGDQVAALLDGLLASTAADGALVSSVVDIAGTQPERSTGGGGERRIDDVNRTDPPTPPYLLAIIRVVVTIPLGGLR
jgi:tetratricopeptide (TPR) repeat protein